MNKQAAISLFALPALGMALAAPVTSADHKVLDKQSEEYFHEAAASEKGFALDGLGSMFRDIQKSKRRAPQLPKVPLPDEPESLEENCRNTVHIEVDILPEIMMSEQVRVTIDMVGIDNLVDGIVDELIADTMVYVPKEPKLEELSMMLEDVVVELEDVALAIDASLVPAAPAAAAAP